MVSYPTPLDKMVHTIYNSKNLASVLLSWWVYTWFFSAMLVVFYQLNIYKWFVLNIQSAVVSKNLIIQ